MFQSFDVVVFDIDGTLVDLFKEHTDAYIEAFAEVTKIRLHDRKYVRSYFAIGSEVKVWEHLLRDAGLKPSKIVISRLRDARTTHFLHIIQQQSRKIPLANVIHTLRQLRKTGKTLYCFSGNTRGMGKLILDRVGLKKYFSKMFFIADKPSMSSKTKILREIIRQEKLVPEKVCVVGDTPDDVLAAKANKMGFVAVATGLFDQKQLAKHAGKRTIKQLSPEGTASRSGRIRKAKKN